MNLISDTFLQGGKYRIIKKLGQGGFGITYLAVQTSLDRKVAIKEFFMADYCQREGETTIVTTGNQNCSGMLEQYKRKFIKEAKTIASLDNSHIIRIYDVFEENGTAYYVMEYLEGGDLKSRIPENGLNEVDATETILQIADGLLYLHERKILHLDIKPSNILYRNDGTAVLIDFGISKHYDRSGEQTSRTPLGISDGYAPLEQYEADGIKEFCPATDIYSLGATFYHMITGKRTPNASQTIKGLPAFSIVVSKNIVQAIQLAMKPSKDDRPQTIPDFLCILKKKTRNRSSYTRRKRYYQKMINRCLMALIPVGLVVVLFTLFPNTDRNQTGIQDNQTVLSKTDKIEPKKISDFIDLSTTKDGVYAVAKNGWGLPIEEADSSCIAVALIQGKYKFWIEKNGKNNHESIMKANVMDSAFYQKYTSFQWGMFDFNVEGIEATEFVGGNSHYYTWGYLPDSNGNTYNDLNKLVPNYLQWKDGALADFNGKSNTKSIMSEKITDKNSHYSYMTTYAYTFNDTPEENHKYTDWYVPALGQLALIYLNRVEIDKTLLKIGGTLLSDNQYWSSSEYNAKEAWGINMQYGGVWHEKKNRGFSIRLIRDNSLNKATLQHIPKSSKYSHM